MRLSREVEWWVWITRIRVRGQLHLGGWDQHTDVLGSNQMQSNFDESRRFLEIVRFEISRISTARTMLLNANLIMKLNAREHATDVEI